MLSKRALLNPLPLTEIFNNKQISGVGWGVAVSSRLKLLVTSNAISNKLAVWSLPDAWLCGLRPLYHMGGAESAIPFKFKDVNGWSGYLAFTPSDDDHSQTPLLLVTDAGHDAVHVINVVTRSHEGYVAAPGMIAGPRGVAACSRPDSSTLVGVSAWKQCEDLGNHVVVLYEDSSPGHGVGWHVVKTIGGCYKVPGQLSPSLRQPQGLRFTRDGLGVCVADARNKRVTLFRVDDGSFMRHLATQLHWPMDVEEVEGGWLVACWGEDHKVRFVGHDSDSSSDNKGEICLGNRRQLWCPSSLGIVPHVGVVVAELGVERTRVYATADDIPMLIMSGIRMAWMTAVARGLML